MDRIIEGLLREFSREYSIASLPEQDRFEHFASFVTVRRHFAETFDTADIVLGESGGMGIDAIATIINGTLVTDVDSFAELADEASYLDVAFVFVQADRGSHFEAQKIGDFAYGVGDFFKPTPALPRSAEMAEMAVLMSAIYDRSGKFKRGNPVCRLYYVTTGKWIDDAALEARRQSAISDLKATNNFRDVELTPVGADLLQRLYSQTKNSISREFQFPNRTLAPEIAGVKEAYLGFLSADEFLSIIQDDDGEIIKSIFYDNVRDWQGEAPGHVNSEIAETIRSNHKDRFVLMNNGVTIIARNLQVTGNKCHVEDFQIVNGCQTSHVLAGSREDISEALMIPLRLISTQDEGVIESIIRATNRQTEVKKEQFFAVTDFAKQLEQFFQAFPDEHKLFYERRSRQYDGLSVEKTRVVLPRNLIRAFAAMFLAEPHRTARSYKLLDAQVGRTIFAEGHKLDPYYTAAFALYKLEYMFRSQKIEVRFRNARFQMLLAARLLLNKSPLPRMNSREMEKYCADINKKMWNPTEADKLFTRAAEIVDNTTGGKLDRDNIHTQPLTEKLVEACGGKVNLSARASAGASGRGSAGKK